MSRTYKVTGINLKSMPLGENDRLLTILTAEQGLIRAVAPGSRTKHSQLAGLSNLFVVNQLMLSQGRNLDRIQQATAIESYPVLSQNLGKLTAAQYLAELVLFQALSHQPQEELLYLLQWHLERLERSASDQIMAHLSHAIFHLLTLAGISPQFHICCRTQQTIEPNFTDPHWRVGFSITAGGIVSLTLEEFGFFPLTATELALLQKLAQPEIPSSGTVIQETLTNSLTSTQQIWLKIERILRQYAQHYFDRPIRSATLIDTCFSSDATA
jgi:DNA repair protein RecO (recombination protein O)